MTSLRLTCPICASRPAKSALAVVSPWIRDLAGVTERTSRYSECNLCDFGWFELAYDNVEMSRIYRDYRGSAYCASRTQWERWYSEEWNHFVSDDSESTKSRRTLIEDFLGDIDVATMGTVADVGGDRGQYIVCGSDRVVVDVSERELVAGVRRVSNISELGSIDLILCAHVLEHIPDPVHELKCFSNAALVYIKVPLGAPNLSYVRTVTTQASRIAARIPALWSAWSQPYAGRALGGSWQPLRQSEHLNFFSRSSLKRLIEVAGRRCLRIETGPVPVPDGHASYVLRALVA